MANSYFCNGLASILYTETSSIFICVYYSHSPQKPQMTEINIQQLCVFIIIIKHFSTKM